METLEMLLGAGNIGNGGKLPKPPTPPLPIVGTGNIGNTGKLPKPPTPPAFPENVTPLWYILFMGSALPYDDRHEADKLIDCDVCGKRFLLYKDKVPTCTDCLQNPTVRRQRSRRDTQIGYLFEN